MSRVAQIAVGTRPDVPPTQFHDLAISRLFELIGRYESMIAAPASPTLPPPAYTRRVLGELRRELQLREFSLVGGRQ